MIPNKIGNLLFRIMYLFTIGNGSFCVTHVSTTLTNLYKNEDYYLVSSKISEMTFTFWPIHFGRKRMLLLQRCCSTGYKSHTICLCSFSSRLGHTNTLYSNFQHKVASASTTCCSAPHTLSFTTQRLCCWKKMTFYITECSNACMRYIMALQQRLEC